MSVRFVELEIKRNFFVRDLNQGVPFAKWRQITIDKLRHVNKYICESISIVFGDIYPKDQKMYRVSQFSGRCIMPYQVYFHSRLRFKYFIIILNVILNLCTKLKKIIFYIESFYIYFSTSVGIKGFTSIGNLEHSY